MKPIIGISANVSPPDDNKRSFSKDVALHLIQDSYIKYVEEAGGIPVLLPVLKDVAAVSEIVERLDGIIITGGVDVDPSLYGEENTHSQGVNPERDAFEINLIKESKFRQVPILSICRGIQIMNLAFGGSLYQDIPTSIKDALLHTRAEDGTETYHQTILVGNSVLKEIFNADEIRTNSSHHQSIREPGEGLTVIAKAADGVVEAVHCADDRCTIGVQWHPERMQDDPKQIALARWFIDQAS